MPQRTPPGWYSDDAGGQRWWDGHKWTDHSTPASRVATPAAVAEAGVQVVRFLKTHPTGNAAWNWAIWALVPVVVISLVGGQTTSSSKRATANRPTSATSHGTGAVATTVATSTRQSSVAMHPSTRPPTVRSTTGPEPSSIGGDVLTPGGVILPDRTRTPGAIDATVTQTNIGSTICLSGWTATVRPSSSYTTALKQRQLATGYAYRGDTRAADYEEDHLISLELGGSPDREMNLWPEPYNASDGARTKDQIENKLHSLVCAGTLSLAIAQRAIAKNWWAAYQTYVGTPEPNPATSSPPAPPKTSSAPAPAPSVGCTPLTNNGNCYTEGQYCRTADQGTYGIAKDGRRIQCTKVGSSWRWRQA